MAYIYQITNKMNGKIYIGKTEFSIEKRFKEHCKDAFKKIAEKRPLYSAMRKYGIENFEISLIEETDCPEEREIYWIEQKRSFKNGYNATVGGDGRKYIDYDLVISEYQILQNMTAVANKLNISVDSVRNILNSKDIIIKSSSEVLKEKNSKIIKMYDMQDNYIQSFSCVKDAARFLIANNYTVSPKTDGVSSHIRDCANHKRKSAYKHIWKW